MGYTFFFHITVWLNLCAYMYTSQSTTSDAGNALYLRHIVVGEVAVTGGIEEL